MAELPKGWYDETKARVDAQVRLNESLKGAAPLPCPDCGRQISLNALKEHFAESHPTQPKMRDRPVWVKRRSRVLCADCYPIRTTAFPVGTRTKSRWARTFNGETLHYCSTHAQTRRVEDHEA